MNDGWMNDSQFSNSFNYMKTNLDETNRDDLKQKADNMLNEMKNSLNNNFSPWMNKLLFFSVFSEIETASVVARFLLRQPPHLATTFYSTVHGTYIDLMRFYEFLVQSCACH